MYGRKKLARQQPVAGHRIENARLPQKHYQHHAGESGQSARRNQVGSLRQPTIKKSNGQRRFDIYRRPRHHARQYRGYQNVEYRAKHQRRDDSDGQVALRILRFLRGSGDRVKSDVSEKDIGRSGANTRKTHGCESSPSRVPNLPGARTAFPTESQTEPRLPLR